MNLKRLIVWSIVGAGISSVATQLLTIREFLTQFSGNEVTISLVLFCWLMMTGLGAFAARFWKTGSDRVYALLILILAVWPLIQILGIRAFRESWFLHGISPGFHAILFYILIFVSPYCLLIGYILPFSQQVLHAARYSFESGDLYMTDSIGDIAGGALFSFILVYWLKPFAIIAATSSLLILIALLLLFHQGRYILIGLTLPALCLFYLLTADHRFEISTLSRQYGHIVRYAESPYGRVVITTEGPQYTIWESGSPLYSEAQVTEAEEKVHYPLSQIDRPKRILLVSGGLGETLKEVAKYGPEQVDYIELDPAVTDAAETAGLIERAPFLSILHTDARRYIKRTTEHYDAILVDLPDPDTFQINRFFTSEFLGYAKSALKEGGVLSLHMAYSPNYLSGIQRKKLSTLYHTARKQFQYVLILPGEQAYFLMSDRELSPDIPSLLRTKGIGTAYIEGYFYGNVTDERIQELKGKLNPNEPPNTDFEPRLVRIVFQEWFTRHGARPVWFLASLLGLTLIYLLFLKRAEYVLFATGFAAMGMEMLIVLAFQVIYGYIYLEIGAVVTAFLMGLLPGALVGQRWRTRLKVQAWGSEIAILLLLIAFFLWVSYMQIEPHPIHFLMFCFVFSFFTGFQFPVASRMIGEAASPAAGLLAADLCGAAVGTLITGALIIPMWGVGKAALLLIVLKISSIMLLMAGRRIGS